MNDSSNKIKVSLKERAEISDEKMEAFKENIKQVNQEQRTIVQKIVSIASTVIVGVTLCRRLHRKIFR